MTETRQSKCLKKKWDDINFKDLLWCVHTYTMYVRILEWVSFSEIKILIVSPSPKFVFGMYKGN